MQVHETRGVFHQTKTKKKFSQGPQEQINTLIDKLFFIIVVRYHNTGLTMLQVYIIPAPMREYKPTKNKT